MELIRSILARLRGDPRVIDKGTCKVLKAAHLRPSSGHEKVKSHRVLLLFGAMATPDRALRAGNGARSAKELHH